MRILVAVLALLFSTATVAQAQDPPQPVHQGPDQLTSDQIIVQWKSGTDRAERLTARAEAGIDSAQNLGNRTFQLLTPERGQATVDALVALRDNPDVVLATRDGYSELHATQPNDPLYGELWGLTNTGTGVEWFTGAVAGDDIDALNAWTKTTGDAGVIMADLDSGYRATHPDLASRVWTNSADPQDGADNDGNGIVDDTHGVDFAGPDIDAVVVDGNPTDDVPLWGGHGVHTAGTMGATGNNGLGITGVSQQSTILPIRVCGYKGTSPGILCPYSSQIAGINYAGSHGATVANMSLGGTTINLAVRNALAVNPGTLFVISAGNDTKNNDSVPSYPCAYDPSTSGIAGAVDNVICVAATDQADKIATFSNWGATTVDIAAPGTETLSTFSHRPLLTETFANPAWPYAGWTPGGFVRRAITATNWGVSSTTTPAQTNGTTRTLSTPTVTIPFATKCRFSSRFSVDQSASDIATWRFKVDGANVASYSIPTGTYNYYFDVDAVGAGSHTLSMEYVYSRSGGVDANGITVDTAAVNCYVPPGQENSDDYAYLQGTSMAAPHVTGAAGLLKSYEPRATALELKQALVQSVDPVADLKPGSGTHQVSSGGRLDANSALDAVDKLVAPDTLITQQPAGTSGADANFGFATKDTKAPATFECSLDTGVFTACGSPATFSGLASGAHSLAVRAKDSFGNVDPSPANASWTVDLPQMPVQPTVQAPGKVIGLKVKRKAKSATVKWAAPLHAVSFQVRWTKGGKKYGKWVNTSATKKTIKRLSPKKRYRVQIVAVNAAGKSPVVTVTVKKFQGR